MRGLVRDYNGNLVMGFQKHIGTRSALAAELWGICDGPQVARDHRRENIIVVTDALTALNTIQGTKLVGSHPLSALIL